MSFNQRVRTMELQALEAQISLLFEIFVEFNFVAEFSALALVHDETFEAKAQGTNKALEAKADSR